MAAARAVPSPVDIARGEVPAAPFAPPSRETAAAAPAAAARGSRPTLKIVMRRANPENTAGDHTGVGTGEEFRAGASHAQMPVPAPHAELEEWFSSEFGCDQNASNA